MSDGVANVNVKLLDYYQSIISRVAGDSSSLKSWAVSLGTAVVGFAIKDGPPMLAHLALVPLVLFFALDAYYLAAERAYRKKYNEAAEAVTPLPLTIPAGLVTGKELFLAAIQPATWSIYLALAVVAVAVGAGLLSAK